ncbi:MAG: hypothetical protein ACI8RD_010092 [Bacillariaceae sp.]|jgi:hypothetical protein
MDLNIRHNLPVSLRLQAFFPPSADKTMEADDNHHISSSVSNSMISSMMLAKEIAAAASKVAEMIGDGGMMSINNATTKTNSDNENVAVAAAVAVVVGKSEKYKNINTDDEYSDIATVAAASKNLSQVSKEHHYSSSSTIDGDTADDNATACPPRESAVVAHNPVKKEEEVKKEVKYEKDNDYHDWVQGNWCWLLPCTDKEDNTTRGVTTTTTHAKHTRNKKDDDGRRFAKEKEKDQNTTAKDTSDQNYNYDDWVTGNWCWLIKQQQKDDSNVISQSSCSKSIITTTSTRTRRAAPRSNKRCREDDCAVNQEDIIDISDDLTSKEIPIKRTKRQITKHKNWNDMFERLVGYKQKFNSTVVSEGYSEDPQLARWVRWQRHLYRLKKNPILYSKQERNIISDERVDLLNYIDFEFDLYQKTMG